MDKIFTIDIKQYFQYKYDDILKYEYVERYSILNLKEYVKQLIPILNEPKKYIY